MSPHHNVFVVIKMLADKLSRKKLLGITLIMLVIASISFSTVYAQTNDQERDRERDMDKLRDRDETRAEHMIEAAERAKEKVEDLVELIAENKSLMVPENVTSLYQSGIVKLEEAKAAEDPATAIELAREAMMIFRETFRSLFHILGQANAELIREEVSHALETAIQRTEDKLERVEDLVARIKDQGVDTAAAEEYLREAAEKIAEAKQLLSEDKINEAAKLLGEARRLISKAITSLKWGAGQLNAARVKAFAAKTDKMIERIRRQAEKRGWGVSHLEENVERAVQLARQGDVKGAIHELIEARRSIKDIQRGPKGP